MGWLSAIFGLFKGPLSRVLDTVDRKVAADTDKAKLKADIIKSHFENRASFMAAGGFWLIIILLVPIALWLGMVAVYSSFWCSTCLWPYAGLDREWVVAALPPPIGPILARDGTVVSDGYAGLIIMAALGVTGLIGWRR